MGEETNQIHNFKRWPHEEYSPTATKTDENLTTGKYSRGANRAIVVSRPTFENHKVSYFIDILHELENLQTAVSPFCYDTPDVCGEAVSFVSRMEEYKNREQN